MRALQRERPLELQRERPFGRDMAAVAGALAVGMVTSRLLPPLLASAAGSLRATLGEDPFARLARDHRYILSLLERMRRAPQDSLSRRAANFLALKRSLSKHALAEEDIVYPLLLREGASTAAARQLYIEHAEMKVHLYELEGALRGDGSWTARVVALQALIERHAREEEDVEFPKLQLLLDSREKRKLAGQIRREEALVL
jgi:hemerythrin superfamily protein